MAHELAYSRGVVLVDYGREVEEEIARLQERIEGMDHIPSKYAPRWLALKLLEEDPVVSERVGAMPGGPGLIAEAEKSVRHLRSIYGDDVDTIIADRRYGFISGLVKETVKRSSAQRMTASDQIDKVVTNRVLGIPIFLVAMWIVFQVTANASGPYNDWVGGVIGGPITNWVLAILGVLGLGGTWVESLLVDGVIAGVGGVLVFVPLLMILYVFLAILEDSGYMARAAFVMDRLMHAVGLHGKSFLPMIVGFGCTVPAIYATRTLENEDDRILTSLIVPFMSCGARLPVYVVLGAAFFGAAAGRVIFWLYVLGIVMAILSGILLRKVLFSGKQQSPFVMELPPYRMPTLKGVLIHMWERTSAFVYKAATIIMVTSIIIWFLMSMPWGVEHPRDSYFGKISAAVSPVFAPAGFGTWEASGSLITGFVAKEVVVGTMSQIYAGSEAEEAVSGEPLEAAAGEEVGLEEAVIGEPAEAVALDEEEATPSFVQDVAGIVTSFVDATVDFAKSVVSIIPGIDLMGEEEPEEEDTALTNGLQNTFTPLSAMSFMVFVLLYTPCMVAVAAQRAEFGTKWMAFGAVYLLAVAWIVSVIVYQGGRLLGYV